MYLNASYRCGIMCTMGSARPAVWSGGGAGNPGDAHCPDQYFERGACGRRLVEYTLKRCGADGAEASSVNPVVGECNDSRINRISLRAVKKEDVFSAIDQAGEEFEEGCVGAGAGTLCYGFKGGIGSASRVVAVGEKEYTIGVLVQSNFGATRFLTIDGRPVGERFWRLQTEEKIRHAPSRPSRPGRR